MKRIMRSLRSRLGILHALHFADAVSNCRSWPSARSRHIFSRFLVYCVTERMTDVRFGSVGPSLSGRLFVHGRFRNLKDSCGCVRAYYRW
jgi:hypothetical protein